MADHDPLPFPGEQHRPRRQGAKIRQALTARKLPLNRLVPNMLTLLALCSGLTGIRFAFQLRFEPAIIAILVAAALDTVDGRVARLLKSANRFGAELDSLADAVSFGVAPALILFLWSLRDAGDFGWCAALVFAVCCALRLARFNTMLDAPHDESHAWTKAYFVGVPTPAGAGLALLPMILSFEFPEVLNIDFNLHLNLPPRVLACWLLFVGALMVSRLPTFSMKGIRVPVSYLVPLFVAVGLLGAALATNTWFTLGLVGIAYLALLPISWWTYRRHERSASPD